MQTRDEVIAKRSSFGFPTWTNVLASLTAWLPWLVVDKGSKAWLLGICYTNSEPRFHLGQSPASRLILVLIVLFLKSYFHTFNEIKKKKEIFYFHTACTSSKRWLLLHMWYTCISETKQQVKMPGSKQEENKNCSYSSTFYNPCDCIGIHPSRFFSRAYPCVFKQ